MSSKYNQKTRDALKAFVLLALLITIAGCRASSETSDPGKNMANENLRTVQRENPNSSPEAAKTSNGSDSNSASATNGKSPANADNTAKSVEQASTAETVVRHDGFGKIKVGMTVAQASQALGAELVRGKGYEDACFYVDPKGIKGVRFMVTNGKIARIDVSSNKYATDKGARIGDTEDRIKSLYPGIKVYPQKYDEKKHDMEINSGDKKYLIIFETDGKRVTGFRVGNTEEVGYVEGCS